MAKLNNDWKVSFVAVFIIIVNFGTNLWRQLFTDYSSEMKKKKFKKGNSEIK